MISIVTKCGDLPRPTTTTTKASRCTICGHRTRRPSGLCPKCESSFSGCTSCLGRHPRGGLDYTPEMVERWLGLDAGGGHGRD